MTEYTKTSSPLLIVVAWAIVVLPTAWGLSYTVRNAMAIFHPAAPATPPSSK